MEDNKYNKKVLFDTKFVICLIIIGALALALVFALVGKDSVEPEIMEQSESIVDDNTEFDLNTEYLPLIRLSNYDEETGNRDGIVITNNGTIYKYAFNETAVIYPDSDVFAVNQTLYFNNLKEEVGTIEPEDLTLLIRYCETIENE